MTTWDLMRLSNPGDTIENGQVKFVVTEVVDGHVWGNVVSLIPGECCRICGLMRRADKSNKPCKGPVELSLR